jgi:hypothetical protein
MLIIENQRVLPSVGDNGYYCAVGNNGIDIIIRTLFTLKLSADLILCLTTIENKVWF